MGEGEVMPIRNEIGDGPVEQAYVESMTVLARLIQEVLNPGGVAVKDSKVGFVLLVFEMGHAEDGRMNYMSNADRENVKTALKEQLTYFDGMPNTRGKA